MFANMCSDYLAVLGVCMGQNPLDEVVAILVAGNIDEGNSRTVHSTFADAVEIAAQELSSSDLKALFYYFRGVLIHAVLGCESNDMLDGSTSISRSTMLTDVLNAPVAELAMSDDVNVLKHLLNARSLYRR
jgi:hypothetical protein